MRYVDPNQPGSKVQFKAQYENFIGGQWVAPVKGEYFDNISPVDGKVFTKVPRSSAEDIELALDAAHKAKAQWGSASPTTRSNILLKIADRLEENLELSRYSNDNKFLLWDIYDSYPNNIYKNLTESELYKTYMNSGNRSFEEDKEFILNFFVELIAEYEDLHDYLEGIQITWADDVHIANAMVHTTIKSFRQNSSPLISLFKVYKDVDDKKFTEELFRKTIRHQSETKNMIDEKAENWELERIATIDLIILEMALTEFMYFPNIPAKVTINEYVELAKNYSTEKSRVFVNGILDKTLKELKDNNNLPKYGRGLL